MMQPRDFVIIATVINNRYRHHVKTQEMADEYVELVENMANQFRMKYKKMGFHQEEWKDKCLKTD